MAMLMGKPFGSEEPIWMSDRGYREEPPYMKDAISYRNYPEPFSFRYPEPPTTFGRIRELPPMYPDGPAAYGMFLEHPRLARPRHHPDVHLPQVDRFRDLVEQPRSRQIRRGQPQKVHPEIELRVPMSSSSSEDKIRNELKKTEGVTKVECDRENQKVTVTGKVDPEALLKRAKKVQRTAEFWSKTIYSQNFIDFIQSKTAPPKEPEVEVFSSFRHQSAPEMRIDTHDPYYDTERSATFSHHERDSTPDDASHYNSKHGSPFSSSSSYSTQPPLPSFYFGKDAYHHSDERERVEASYSSPYTPVAYGEMDSHLQSVTFPSRLPSYRHHHHGEEFYEKRDYNPEAYESSQLGTSYPQYESSSYETYYDSHPYQDPERSSIYANDSSSDWKSENSYYPHNAYNSSQPIVVGDSGITNPNYMQHIITDY